MIFSHVLYQLSYLATRKARPAVTGRTWDYSVRLQSRAMRQPCLARPVARLALCLALAGLPCAARAQGAFTVEQALSAPFPTELVAAPAGARVAFALFERGLRNVYVAEAPGFTARRVTSYAADDGQELSGLAFSGDGAFVVYARGGDHGSNWEPEGKRAPNPASSPAQPKVQVWAVPAAAGDPVLIGEGDQPAPVPGSNRVAFIRDDRVWAADIGGKPAAMLFWEAGKSRSLAWSPDGGTLAFVSDRGDHSFVGLFSAPDRPLRYLAPGTSRDGAPVWSPDGRRVAFVRRPGRGGVPHPPLQQVPRPWAIWVADAATGAAHEVWHSGATLADSIPDVGGPNLRWAGNDRLAFLSYRDGWPHLYSVPAAGGSAPLLLTPGRFMVESFSVAPDGRSVLYSANTGPDANDIDRRHLFRVPVDRAAPEALTPGAGIEWSPLLTADAKWIVYIGADAQRAGLPKARPAGGGETVGMAACLVPAGFPAGRLVTPEPAVVKSSDGLDVHCQVFRTPGGPARRPAVIFVHGGPPRQMLLGWHYMFYYSNTYALNQYLASRGFLVLSVNYRLGIGYGHAFNYPDAAGDLGASEYRDVLAAGRYLQSRPDVDPRRIAIYGGSYGGFLTALALGRDSDVFAAGVDVHGVHDWLQAPPDRLRMAAAVGDGVTEEELRRAAAVAWESSPASSVSTWRSPVLLIHADDDRNVEFGQTTDLARRLAAAGVPFEEIVIPDDIHDFLLFRNWVRVGEATAEFLERQLGRR